jgi:hypothetical protein
VAWEDLDGPDLLELCSAGQEFAPHLDCQRDRWEAFLNTLQILVGKVGALVSGVFIEACVDGWEALTTHLHAGVSSSLLLDPASSCRADQGLYITASHGYDCAGIC